MIDPLFQRQNKSKKDSLEEKMQNLTKQLVQTNSRIIEHQEYSVFNYTQMENKLKSQDEHRFFQQLEQHKLRFQKECERYQQLLLEYQMCINGERPNKKDLNSYSDDENMNFDIENKK